MNQLQDDIVAVLEEVVEACIGNIWYDYKNKIKNPAIEEATKTLTELIAKRVVAELESLNNSFDGVQPDIGVNGYLLATIDRQIRNHIKQLSSTTPKGKDV